jgi:hypothetical protein
MKRTLDWLPVALGIALLSTLVGLPWDRTIRGQNDFVALYVGAKLVGSPELYSRPANEAMIKSILGATMQSVTYTRPPFYAALLKPLSFLPYHAAYAIFCAVCLASILWFVVRFSKEWHFPSILRLLSRLRRFYRKDRARRYCSYSSGRRSPIKTEVRLSRRLSALTLCH